MAKQACRLAQIRITQQVDAVPELLLCQRELTFYQGTRAGAEWLV